MASSADRGAEPCEHVAVGSGQRLTFFFGFNNVVASARRLVPTDADWGLRADCGLSGFEDPLDKGPPNEGLREGRAEAGRRVAGELITEGTTATLDSACSAPKKQRNAHVSECYSSHRHRNGTCSTALS